MAVIHFPTPVSVWKSIETVPLGSEILRDTTKAEVIRLSDVTILDEDDGLFIHEERFWKTDFGATEFFDALAGTDLVTISLAWEEIDRGAVLIIWRECGDDWVETFELTVGDFVRFTEEEPGTLPEDEFGGFVLSKIATLWGIEVQYVNDGKETVILPSIDSLEDSLFCPEEIAFSWEWFLHFILFPLPHAEPITVTCVDFESPLQANILHALCLLWRQLQEIQYIPRKNDYAELNRMEGTDSDVRPISLLWLDEILDKSLLKAMPMLANYPSLWERIRAYFTASFGQLRRQEKSVKVAKVYEFSRPE